MLNLLLTPVKTYLSLFTALALPHYISLYSAQTYSTRRSVAREIVQTILRDRIQISTTEQLQGVISILNVIISEGIQQPVGYLSLQSRQRGESDETIQEQGWLARLVHLIQGPTHDIQHQVRKPASWSSKTNSRSSFEISFTHTRKVKNGPDSRFQPSSHLR